VFPLPRLNSRKLIGFLSEGRNHAAAWRIQAAKIRGVGFFIVVPYVKAAPQAVNLMEVSFGRYAPDFMSR
jgi:hypothetical protein